MLSKYTRTDQTDWDEFLPMCLLAYRTTPASESTELSPFQILYGRDPKLPVERMMVPPQDLSNSVQEHVERIMAKVRLYQQQAKENVAKHNQKMKERYDRDGNSDTFQVGDTVWLYVPKCPPNLSRKLVHKWHGPYRIIEKPKEIHCFLRSCDSNKLLPVPVHVNRLKRAFERNLRPADEIENELDDELEQTLDPTDLPTDSFEEIEVDGNEEFWPVEKIIRGRKKGENIEYLVNWRGCSAKDNSWVPAEHLNDQARDYLTKNKIHVSGK